MDIKDIKILVCTLDDSYKNELSTRLKTYNISFVTDIDMKVFNYYRIIIIDANTFVDETIFMKYSDILFMQSNTSIIIVRPMRYMDYITMGKISEDIIITEDIEMAIDKIVNTKIGVLRAGDLILDAFCRKIYYKNEFLADLTPKYLYILQEMIYHFGELVESKYLMEIIWGSVSYKNKRCLDVMMRYIKEIISKDKTIELKTIYAEGYILKIKED